MMSPAGRTGSALAKIVVSGVSSMINAGASARPYAALALERKRNAARLLLM